MQDPNNTLGNPAPTHINAFYSDLAVAEEELKLAQGKVQAAKDAIVANGGTLPEDSADTEDINVAGDEAQLSQDEAADGVADASEPAESDAPAPAAPVDESPAPAPAPAPADQPAA